jgi:hypothetical protein
MIIPLKIKIAAIISIIIGVVSFIFSGYNFYEFFYSHITDNLIYYLIFGIILFLNSLFLIIPSILIFKKRNLGITLLGLFLALAIVIILFSLGQSLASQYQYIRFLTLISYIIAFLVLIIK